ncbi:MAG: insulinase family protein [Deltaproteobacteria bacterium]|jgi:predicted Zn-dependent peptidase|nr:insulinase family protein [Deltaproteobacteria bacterium]
MRKILLVLVAVLLSISCSRTPSYDLSSKVHEFTLENGMKWLFVRRPEAPVFSGVVMVRVGGSDEEMGKTGIAHMFEHMAFKGSKDIGTKDFKKESLLLSEIEALGEKREALEKVSKSDTAQIAATTKKMKELEKVADELRIKNHIWDIMIRNGANGMNAYTAKDLTTYYTSMPKNRFELWAKMFSEMIFEPSYREFYIERDVVADERRSLTENNPDREMGEKLLSTSFKSGPYHWSTIGYMDDIQNLTIGDARKFHDKYYVASNMVGVVVGDLTIGEVKTIAKKVFGKYPKKPVPISPTTGGVHNRGVIEKFSFDAEPSLTISYHKPTLPNPDEYVFDVITSLLCEGRSSRIEKDLIFKKRIVKDIYCSDGFPGSRLDNLMLFWVEPMNGQPLDKVLNAVTAEVTRLAEKPVLESELRRVQKQVTAGILFSLDDSMQLALGLARFQTIFGDWKLLASYPEKIAEVKQDDVIRVAKKYMTLSDRVVVERVRGK